MPRRVNTAIANPVRTAVQAAPALILTEFYDSFVADLTEKQYAALAGFLLLAFSFIQNTLENRKGIGFLRQVPPRDVPLIDGE